MTIRKGLFALAATAALAAAARDASALAVTVTIDGCNNGSNIHTTVTFNCNAGLLCLDDKGGKSNNNPLCGGIIFSNSCPGQNLNCPPDDTNNNPPPCNPTPSTDDKGNDKGTDCNTIFGDHGPKECDIPQLKWNCLPDHCCTHNDGPGPTPNAVGPSPTPLPASMWGTSALIGALAFVRRMRRKAMA